MLWTAADPGAGDRPDYRQLGRVVGAGHRLTMHKRNSRALNEPLQLHQTATSPAPQGSLVLLWRRDRGRLGLHSRLLRGLAGVDLIELATRFLLVRAHRFNLRGVEKVAGFALRRPVFIAPLQLRRTAHQGTNR